MDLRGQLASVWLRRWPIVAATVCVALVVLVLRMLTPPVYGTDTTLRVNVPGESGGERAETVEFYTQTLVGLAGTQSVLDDAVSRSGLPITRQDVRERITVIETETPGFLTLTALGPTPRESAALAGAASAALAARLAADEVAATENATAALREQIAALEPELVTLAPLTPARAAAERRYSELVGAVAAVSARPAPSVLLGPPPVASSNPISPTPLRDALLALVIGLIVIAEGVVVTRALRGRLSEGDPAAEIEAATGIPAVQLDRSDDTVATLVATYRNLLGSEPAVTVVQLGRRRAGDVALLLADGAAAAGDEVRYENGVSVGDSPGPGSTFWSLRSAAVDSEVLRLLRDRAGAVVVAVESATTSLGHLRRGLDALAAVGAKPAAMLVWRGRFPRSTEALNIDTAGNGRDTPEATAGSSRLVHLLGDVDGLRTLVCGEPPPFTISGLEAAGATVKVPLGAHAPEPLEPGGWDLVLCAGGHLRDALVAAALDSITPTGRVAVLIDNPGSLLRALQMLQGKPVHGVKTSSSRKVRAQLASHDLQVTQVLGLLRSTAAPVTAFDLAAPAVLDAIVAASGPHIGGLRSAGLRGLRQLSGLGESVGRLLPGMLVLGSRADLAEQQDRITGMIGNRDSREVKLIRGSPPAILDKRYLFIRKADGETAALTALDDAELRIAPRLLQRPTPCSVWMDWLPGEPLDVDKLTQRETIMWVERAARVLIMMQRATLRPETGEVLVHGDFWLGNLLTADDGVTGVIDWTESRWGSPQVDQSFLLDRSLRGAPSAVKSRVRMTCARIFISA